jgi:hypothetical protein
MIPQSVWETRLLHAWKIEESRDYYPTMSNKKAKTTKYKKQSYKFLGKKKITC